MPQVTLHILNCAVFLDVRGGGAAERLLGQIVDADSFAKGFSLFLQIVADAEGRSPAIQERETPADCRVADEPRSIPQSRG